MGGFFSTALMAPLAGIEPASTLLNRQPRAPCSPEGNECVATARLRGASRATPRQPSRLGLACRPVAPGGREGWWSTSDSNRARSPCKGGPRTLRVPRSCAPWREYWRSELVSSQPLRCFGAALSPDQLSEQLERLCKGLARRSFSEGGWRRAEGSNLGPCGPLGFRDRLPATPAAPSDRIDLSSRATADRVQRSRQAISAPARRAGTPANP